MHQRKQSKHYALSYNETCNITTTTSWGLRFGASSSNTMWTSILGITKKSKYITLIQGPIQRSLQQVTSSCNASTMVANQSIWAFPPSWIESFSSSLGGGLWESTKNVLNRCLRLCGFHTPHTFLNKQSSRYTSFDLIWLHATHNTKTD